MQPLRYSINLTLDGCIDHTAMSGGEEMHQHAAETLKRADVLLFGRVLYEMMESAFRGADESEPFVRMINATKKVVVSSKLQKVDWNAELFRGDLRTGVQQLKQQSGKGIYVGGVTLARALAEMGLIDEYEFVIHPRIMGRGPSLFAGLSKPLDLKLVGRQEMPSGAVAMRYEPRR